jgi:hypothetical protein
MCAPVKSTNSQHESGPKPWIPTVIKPHAPFSDIWKEYSFMEPDSDQVADNKMRYLAVVELESSFSNPTYRDKSLIDAIPRPQLSGEGLSVEIFDSTDGATDRRWIAFLGSDQKQSRFQISIAGRAAEVLLELPESAWIEHRLESDPQQTWWSTYLGVAFWLDQPRWPIIESAVWRKGTSKGQGLLFVTVRNYDDKPREVDEVRVSALQPAPKRDARCDVSVPQAVQLHWKIADSTTTQGRTELEGIGITVEGTYAYNYCAGSSLKVTIPVEVSVEAGRVKSVGLVISELNSHLDAPASIGDWKYLSVSSGPNIYPPALRVRR